MSANALFACYDNFFGVDGADFDGTNDYMLRGADLTGNADSGTGIFSAFVRLDGSDGAIQSIIANAVPADGFRIYRGNDNSIYVRGEDTAGSTILNLRSTSAYTASATWIHVLVSWDTASSAHMYINDVDELVTGALSGTIDYTRSNFSVGGYTDGNLKIDGCLSELYFAPGQYLDFSVESNRRKFISASGKPVFLGADGSAPTGTAPIVYLHLDNGEAVANFATNRGTGGNFSITGSLDTSSTSPSD